MAYWRPEGEENPAGQAVRRRRSKPITDMEEVFVEAPVTPKRTAAPHGRAVRDVPPHFAQMETVFVDGPAPKRTQTNTPIRRGPRYSGPVIGTMNTEATVRYYAPRAAAARAQGHRLEGGVLGPGSFHATCACGAKLTPGELSALTTACLRKLQQ